MLKRMVASSLVTVGSLLALAAPSMAASPQVDTWSNHVDREYLSPEELNRARLLSTSEAGRLRVR